MASRKRSKLCRTDVVASFHIASSPIPATGVAHITSPCVRNPPAGVPSRGPASRPPFPLSRVCWVVLLISACAEPHFIPHPGPHMCCLAAHFSFQLCACVPFQARHRPRHRCCTCHTARPQSPHHTPQPTHPPVGCAAVAAPSSEGYVQLAAAARGATAMSVGGQPSLVADSDGAPSQHIMSRQVLVGSLHWNVQT